MWPDNETTRDFLNFGSVADTVAEVIIGARGEPVSIGISGSWGAGKSSLIKLVEESLRARPESEELKDFVFVTFNAWLYQGYDDARAALLNVVADALVEEAESRKTGLAKAKELVKRVKWLRLTRFAGTVFGLFSGLPPGVAEGGVEAAAAGMAVAAKLGEEAGQVIGDEERDSLPKAIHKVRARFGETLDELDVTLVVLVDDLDRCLPETTISTLEAMRLLLFLDRTAFVIAADSAMIKYAVRHHFPDVPDEEVVASYFDKLIQVPIRVPPLGAQEVRAYMAMLYVEASDLHDDEKERIREAVCEQLSKTWQGARVDRAFLQTVREELPQELVARIDTAEKLAPLMTSSIGIGGNPRLIKRFLNALSIRMAISRAHNVGVDEAALAKMLLFERCGNPKAHAELLTAVGSDEGGRPSFLAEWEDSAQKGEGLKLPDPWGGEFVESWLAIPPRLSEMDLRGIIYVSREHAPLVTPEDRLGSEAAELLVALLDHPKVANTLLGRIQGIEPRERAVLMDRLLERAVQAQSWGVPDILEACLVVSRADASQARRLAAFLSERAVSQLKPSIVPKIANEPWAGEVFESWRAAEASELVCRAITEAERGNLTVK